MLNPYNFTFKIVFDAASFAARSFIHHMLETVRQFDSLVKLKFSLLTHRFL